MKRYDVWMEGYAATGEHGTATVVARAVEAENFAEACHKAMQRLKPGAVYADETVYDQSFYSPTNLSYWGCCLFPTEAEARRSFG